MKFLNINIFYNYISFVIVGISGILLNIFLVKVYDIDVLGNFNLMLSFLIILSQLCVGGVQFSVLKHNSNFYKKLSEISKSLLSALILSSFFSLSVICIVFLVSPLLEKLFGLDNFALSMNLILPALLFFALNKILLMSLNGLNLMVSYAVFNALRYVLLLISAVIFYLLDFDAKFIAVILSISESLLFVMLLFFTFIKVLRLIPPRSYWIKRHFFFGLKGLWGGALMETNTRIDVLMIGALLGYGAVGIYSFASMIAEGFAQVYMALKNNVDPVVGNAYFKGRVDIIIETINEIRKKYIPLLITCGVLAVSFYQPIFIHIFDLDSALIEQSWLIFVVLMIFILLSSFYRPFMGMLNQVGKPGKFSQIILIGVGLNVIMNFVFIELFGIYGAALSTGIVFFIESFLLYKFGYKYVFRRKN